MTAPWPKGFQCPPSMRPHVQRVLDGEYALPPGYALESPITVLDVGANVGAFAVWARRQWPDCALLCYEPHPETYKLLEANAHGYMALPAPICKELAVVGKATDALGTLFEGRHNCGEASLIGGHEQNTAKSYMVNVVRASTLLACDVLKLDTEGMEWPILQDYPHRSSVAVIMLEWHSHRDRWQIGALLSETHECVRDDPWSLTPPRGIMVWVQAP